MDAVVPNPDKNILIGVPDRPVGDFFPLETPQPAPDEFEIGLVLGGTVSAAAYTAGVLDFLIEALDAWTVAKAAGGVPNHKVTIKIVSGTSGGGVNSVLLARALGYAFPHFKQGLPADALKKNPLYDLWVNQIDIRDLLKCTDLDSKQPISSLLCADKIESAANAMGEYKGDPLGTGGTPATRPYVEQLLPVVVTLTNLRGVPYSSDFRGTSGRPEFFTDRADHIRFRVDIRGNNPPAPGNLRPYEVGISDTPANGVQPWPAIVKAARGTSAFPIGLPPQTISRSIEHYRYRYTILDGVKGSEAVWMRPVWPFMIPVGDSRATPYQFLCVDGGCINNEPVEFARQWIAGVLGHNDRTATGSHRAVVLVDPFADRPEVGLVNDPGILGDIGPILSALVAGGRFSTADRDLFSSEDVYSRFLVNAIRPIDPVPPADATSPDPSAEAWTGGDALATAGLAAFGGFFQREFREHDFVLGRRNCQSFLRKHFVLDAKNTLFNGWTNDQRQKFGAGLDGFLPVVPLMDSVAAEIPVPHWPRNAFDIQSIHDLLKARLKKLADIGTDPIVASQSGLNRVVLRQVIGGATDFGFDKIQALIIAGLKTAHLMD